MKKVYLLVSGVILAAGAVNAQVDAERAYLPFEKQDATSRTTGLVSDDRAPGDIILADDFSDFTNWDIGTEGGTVPEFTLETITPANVVAYGEAMASPTNANGFGVFDGITYLLDGTVEAADATLTYGSTIDCSGATAVTLEFFAAYRAFNSDDVFVEVSNDGWASFESMQLFVDMPTNDPTRQEVVLRDITAVAAGEAAVEVRFRWTELGADPGFGSGYFFMVDDFKVKEAWDYDVEITASYHRSGVGVYMENGMEYYQIPESQITEIEFAGKVQNLGGVTQNNAKLNVEVVGAGAYSGTSAGVDLPVGASDSVSCTTTLTPAASGDYNVTYFFDSDDAEEETVNDTIVDAGTIQVNEFMYARDNGIGGSSIGNVTSNTGAPLLIGNTMDIFGDAVIGAVDIVVTADADNVGKLIFAQIMIYDDGAGAFIYADQTEDHEITSGENGGPIKVIFEEAVEVFAGQTILVLAGHYGGAIEARFRMAQGVDEQTVLGYTSGASDPFFLQSPSAIMVRLDMNDYTSLDEITSNNFSISQNMPNPFGDNSVINYELNEAAAVNVEFVDVSGKIVKSINNGTQAAGTYTLAIDANDFAEGVYFYTFTVGAEKVTKRMVITK
ncbi:MAG: T9SS type A sorting domain-containing protein [Crocinitomix sp.]|nr:T9SS type A sorting domain-containing protein [Crocinitomix sp.]